ncbi:dITP/XTP pyrophosphatase (Non-canonical purine NTP pyrophosphatase) (Non-standard purine NTP pyrophosphatase) (Nucleoside-triphosphate diphosphatase) (Nucleoside-triphosphate pyrophosphatase) (NTPase) [Durusdinium trenchii]|uniref:DITP/XTP pyrophosphatase (Non-canonical purine NTP pyrophosphatase) (Non-standard purine NTP pyrophosphatase) (Nucleoside-triphosphate diphosphatase) (Nucleoside-triphosphate pyrophosphatase) (NTPase) n=1 Tax=Durusdinium trenchii TaxID=1381693 RepID=A0ABP0J7J9_9DINO
MGGDSKGKGKGGARKPRGGRGGWSRGLPDGLGHRLVDDGFVTLSAPARAPIPKPPEMGGAGGSVNGMNPGQGSRGTIAREGNEGKLDFLRIVLDGRSVQAESAMKKGVVDSVEKCAAELPELQADSFAEICRAKAQEAFHQLGANVVVQDSGFVIEALNGFPGPYTKYVLATIGVSGLLKLMEGQSNRRCGFMACVGFADASGQVHVFEEPRPYYGTLTTAPREAAASLREGQQIGQQWGNEAGKLFDVFVPDDLQCAGQTLGEMTEAQLTEYRRRRRSAFRVFAEPQMNLVNLSTAIHRVAKIVGTDPWQQGQLRQSSSLETLLNSVCTALNVVEATEVQPQSVSNVVWSLATLRIVHRPLLQVISLVCVSNMEQFKSFELSTTLWALAKLGSLEDAAPVDKAVFYAAATHIHNHVNDFGFRCLATTAWAFATAKQRHARLFRSMAAAMLPAAAGANCQEMANTAWAFGTADFHDDALFHELAEQAIKRLEEFKPQELSNMLWGFATNSFFHEAFYARASAVAASMDLQSQHLANILWAFARVRPKHPLTQQTVLTLLPVCTRQLSTFKPQEVSSTLLATAKAVGNMDEMTPMAPTLENFRQEVLDFFHACLSGNLSMADWEALGGGADVRLLRAVLGQLRSGDRASQTGTAQKKGKAWH